ncbi:MAG: hypothetical protein DHS20C17_26340 [Cyclobacteriaceae bacterium]|nr:MAG: hypothetical protein DHS20C17_26340 [Cyclobacteriaceae bacterium]
MISTWKSLEATHIRAAEITSRRLSNVSLQYEFTLTGYTDTGSPVRFGDGMINFGDGEEVQIDLEASSFVDGIFLGNNNEIEQYIIKITHTYNSPGVYTISYREPNRNDEIVNINKGNSVQTPFYIESQILIDPFIGLNSSPILLVPPIDRAGVGVKFIHNPGAFDPDGDSLSYCFVIPLQDQGQVVPNYEPLNDPDFYIDPLTWDLGNEGMTGPATLVLDSLTGDLIWDAPGNLLQNSQGEFSEYNVAFYIKEWRKINGAYRQIGFVTRDMQIIVEGTDNERPEVIIPADTCVEAGTTLAALIQGNDPDNDYVLLESFGGVYQDVPLEFATYSAPPGVFPPIFQPQPGLLEFEWETNCDHVRERPYQIQFKVTDSSTVDDFHLTLVDIKTWNVTVVAPAPVLTGIDVASSTSVNLTWENYQNTCANNPDVEIEIWRRIGSFDFTPEGCMLGIPEGSGYELVGTVAGNETSFFDDNEGNGLNPGSTYCYRLVAVFPEPSGGISYASNEICETIILTGSVLTNVDITETSETAGEIFVRWIQPINVDPGVFPPPYSYQLSRSLGFSGSAGRQVLATGLTDTTFIDTGLNTMNQVYNYRVTLFDNNGTMVDSSASASSVRLDAESLNQSIQLRWEALVPWSINTQGFPIHNVYRNNVLDNFPDSLVLIAQVNVTGSGLMYLDDGSDTGDPLSQDLEYCYYVETFGSYDNPLIEEPLINKSQIICAQPGDEIPPCTPILSLEVRDCEQFLADKPCDFSDFSNTISWRRDPDASCDDDIRSFNIYFSADGPEGSFEIVANVIDTFFIHQDLPSFAGCYQVSAVDRSGNESGLSEVLCIDNCPNYYLPNVFTPDNGDNFNDQFQAYFNFAGPSTPDYTKCPRFVEAINIQIVNRWGKEVYSFSSNDGENEGNVIFRWDGNDKNGNPSPGGIYYYVADVTYNVLDPAQRTTQVKGWVHLLRQQTE